VLASGWVGRVHGGNEGQVGTHHCRARGGDRFALALTSPALDEVDATDVLRRHRRSSAVSSIPADPGERFVADALVGLALVR
jgi:hypothetical protein